MSRVTCHQSEKERPPPCMPSFTGHTDCCPLGQEESGQNSKGAGGICQWTGEPYHVDGYNPETVVHCSMTTIWRGSEWLNPFVDVVGDHPTVWQKKELFCLPRSFLEALEKACSLLLLTRRWRPFFEQSYVVPWGHKLPLLSLKKYMYSMHYNVWYMGTPYH